MKKINFKPLDEVADVLQTYPKKSSKLIPDWFKKIMPYPDNKKTFMPSSNSPTMTIKKCVPFLDAMSAGYMVVLPEDVYVERIGDGINFRWSSGRALIEEHSTQQYPGMPIPPEFEQTAFKWLSGWSIITPKGYSLLFTHPSNYMSLPFFIFSGLVDSDNFEQPVNLPFLIRKDFEGIIPKDTPIAQIIPIKRENWISRVHKYDNSWFLKQKFSFLQHIHGFYKKTSWVKKEYN